jgi:cytoskeletal protein CcmA (bactofilin family)
MAVIGRSIQINGDLRGEEDLRIEGDIDGKIHLPNHSLTIGKEGRINADVYAKSVTIDGEMNGDAYGSECVNIRSNARVVGNVVASRVSLEEGARFKGSIDMDPESVKTALDSVQGTKSSKGETSRSNGSGQPGVRVPDASHAKSTAAKNSTAEAAG